MNEILFFFFYNLAHKSVFFDTLVIFLAVYFPFVVVLVAFLFLFIKSDAKKWKNISFVFLSGAFALVIAIILKNLFQSPRPFLVFPDISPLFIKGTFSFPSEHAAFFFALAIAIFLLHRKAGLLFMFFAILIGIARVISGVHFPVDILVGFILGAITAFVGKKL